MIDWRDWREGREAGKWADSVSEQERQNGDGLVKEEEEREGHEGLSSRA